MSGKQWHRFIFFNPEVISESLVGINPTQASLSDLNFDDIVYLSFSVYLASYPSKKIYEFVGGSIQKEFLPYNDTFYHLGRTGDFLILFGVDNENGIKSSSIKIYENTLDDKPKKNIIIGKIGIPLSPFSSLDYSNNLSIFAFGCLDGALTIVKGKNMVFDNTQTMNLDNSPILAIKITNDGNVFAATQKNLFSISNSNQNQKRLLINKQILFLDCFTKKNEIIALDDLGNISQFSSLQKVNDWSIEGSKSSIALFQEKYLIVKSKSPNGFNFTIYDNENHLIAFSSIYTQVLKYFTRGEQLLLLVANSKGEKQILKFSEKDNIEKLNIFFKREFFEAAQLFAKNMGANDSLLAEISKLHADKLYNKGDYSGSMKQYISTIGYLEPPYVIRRFLDVSLIDHFIEYLEALHAKKMADKFHTALLLNCYVKLKRISDLQNFASQSNFDLESFDTESAIKVCRELNHTDLALTLAEKNKHSDLFLEILIDDKKDYKRALQFLLKIPELEKKIKYLKEFGQILMKHEPDKTTEFIFNLIALSALKKKSENRRPPSSEDKDIMCYLGLDVAIDWDRLNNVIFPKPDELFHLFVLQKNHMEKYLNFLKNLKGLPNEMAVFHRLFEFYLEDWSEYYVKNIETLKYRQTIDYEFKKKEDSIMEILSRQEYERKFDRSHLLVLFKMYNFATGYIYLCEKLDLKEELLYFHIKNKDHIEIIEACKKFGTCDPNLWVQALKFFSKPENRAEHRIPDILEILESHENISPLLILNILAKSGNLSFKLIKPYFTNKIISSEKEIKAEEDTYTEIDKKSKEFRNEYKKLKTSAKLFKPNKCVACEMNLTLPAVHFMCGHSFHDNCLVSEKPEKECQKCFAEHRRLLEMKENLDCQILDPKTFYEKLETNENFDFIAEYLGKGAIKI